MPIQRFSILLTFVMTFVMAVAQLSGNKANADGFFLKGIVRDSVSEQPLARASVVALPSARGAVSDDRGIFGIAIHPGDTALRVSSVGYRAQCIPVRRNSFNMIVAWL